MSVEFDEEAKFNSLYSKSISRPSTGLTGWLINVGISKDEKDARNIMIIVAIICFALSIYFATK